jgi:chromosome partitioning protein
MGKIITIASHKGGVGKTTTVLNLGYSLSRFGQKVLLVDSDPQGAIAIVSNLKKRTTKGLMNLLKNESPPGKIIVYTRDKTMGVVGAGELDPEDVLLFEKHARQGNLGKAILSLSEGFDYVFIDAPAGIGTISASLLTISHSVLIPINCRTITVKTLPSFLKLIQKIRKKLNPELKLEGIVVNMAENRETAIAVLEELTTSFPPAVLFETMIPYDESFERASAKSIPVALLRGGEESARYFMDLAMELKKREIADQAKEPGGEDAEGLF